MQVLRYVLALSAMMFFMPFTAYASDAVAADDGGVLAVLIGALPSLVSSLPSWAGGIVGVLYAITHLIATLPTGVTESWPSWLKKLVNLLAANYGKAKNADG